MRFPSKAGLSALAAAALLALPISFLPVQTAHADILGTVLAGVQQKSLIDQSVKHYDQTKEGQTELYDAFTQKQGVVHDSYLNGRLDSIMTRLSSSIAKTDPSIKELPYRWFINPSKEFNASCAMGHVMTVNEGLFDLLNNDDEIAVVLGHEMGHGQKHHVASAQTKMLNVEVGKALLAESLGASAINNLVLNTLANNIETVHITRNDEWQADNLSFDYVTGAGYNPGATAAVWQRVMEKYGNNKQSFVGDIFSPSDHPSHQQRRDNYEKKLYEMSGKHVEVKNGTVYVNGKEFVKPAATGSMSSAERSYFVQGNLAAAYKNGHSKNTATASGNTVYLGAQNIMTSASGDPSAAELAAKLNKIK